MSGMFNGMCGAGGCAAKRSPNKVPLRKSNPDLYGKGNGGPVTTDVNGSDEALAQSEALIALIETAISRRSEKLKAQGVSEMAPGGAESVAQLLQPADARRR